MKSKGLAVVRLVAGSSISRLPLDRAAVDVAAVKREAELAETVAMAVAAVVAVMEEAEEEEERRAWP